MEGHKLAVSSQGYMCGNHNKNEGEAGVSKEEPCGLLLRASLKEITTHTPPPASQAHSWAGSSLLQDRLSKSHQGRIVSLAFLRAPHSDPVAWNATNPAHCVLSHPGVYPSHLPNKERPSQG